MSWLPVGRQIIIVAASLCGIGYFAYIMLFKKQDGNRRKGLRKSRGRKLSALESEIFLRFTEAEDGLQKQLKCQDGDQQVFNDLEVTMDQLEYLVSCINDMELLTETSDYVVSVKEKIFALNNMIDARSNKIKITSKPKVEESESKSDRNVLRIMSSGSANAIIDIGDNDDAESSCSDDSFVSAAESIPEMNLGGEIISSDDESRALLLQYGHLEFYREGIMSYTEHGINVRTLRTEMLGCENDADFKVKVYCLRQAFDEIFHKEEWRKLVLEISRNMLNSVMTTAEKNTVEFQNDFDVLVDYCNDERNWIAIEEELGGRGVCCMNFYDIALDFIIMDAFDDLANPPYVLTSVLQNGWLTNSIKKSTLSGAVWSLLTAKIRMLQNVNAFMGKIYQLSQHTTPVLLWGLLGPDEKLKSACQSFKDALLGFLQDIFSLSCCNYQTKEKLSYDIIANAQRRLSQEET